MRLNIDLGELADEPEELYALADLANLALGGHAGDASSVRTALALCTRHGTQVGAHPSYPDRPGFGRRKLDLPLAELRAAFRAQLGLLAGARVGHMKPHGALYHAADHDEALAEALVAESLATLGELAVVGPAGGALAAAAARHGLAFLREGFADRARRLAADGRWQLVPRGEPGAVLADPAQAVALVHALRAEAEVDTVCVHGDGPAALVVARAVRAALDAT